MMSYSRKKPGVKLNKRLYKKQKNEAKEAYIRFFIRLSESFRNIRKPGFKNLKTTKTKAFKQALLRYYSQYDLQHVFFPSIKKFIIENKATFLALKPLQGIRVSLSPGNLVITRGFKGEFQLLFVPSSKDTRSKKIEDGGNNGGRAIVKRCFGLDDLRFYARSTSFIEGSKNKRERALQKKKFLTKSRSEIELSWHFKGKHINHLRSRGPVYRSKKHKTKLKLATYSFWAEKGDLLEYLRKEGHSLTDSMMFDFILQILLGAKAIYEKDRHGKRKVYQDFKAENVLVFFTKDGQMLLLKICDFDPEYIADENSEDSLAVHQTREYVSPEILKACEALEGQESDEGGELFDHLFGKGWPEIDDNEQSLALLLYARSGGFQYMGNNASSEEDYFLPNQKNGIWALALTFCDILDVDPLCLFTEDGKLKKDLKDSEVFSSDFKHQMLHRFVKKLLNPQRNKRWTLTQAIDWMERHDPKDLQPKSPESVLDNIIKEVSKEFRQLTLLPQYSSLSFPKTTKPKKVKSRTSSFPNTLTY